jgi:hypothetical protein
VDGRGEERLAGWVLAFVGVLAVALGVGWWFAAAPPPLLAPPAAQGEDAIAEPEQQQTDYDLLQQVGLQLPVMAGSVVYDVTMLNPGDWRAYEVPESVGGHELLVVCRGGDDVLVTVPSQTDQLGMRCDGEALRVPVDGTGGTVNVRRLGSAAAALAIRITPAS